MLYTSGLIASWRRIRLWGIGYKISHDLAGIVVGMLHTSKKQAKLLSFAEGAGVSPQHLADYIAEFRTLFDSHNLTYSMFGYVSAGALDNVLHSTCAIYHRRCYKNLSDQIIALTAKYGGLLLMGPGKDSELNTARHFFNEDCITNCV
ncbi:MAG: FAD-linked oxidase C-terminal domain-containing protein [Candidatus Malihini olakiniferum]